MSELDALTLRQRGPNIVQRRTTFRAGWLGVFEGESLGSSIDRELNILNEAGYRVVFMVPDRWSLGRYLLNFLIAGLTLGVVVRVPGQLIIAERRDEAGS